MTFYFIILEFDSFDERDIYSDLLREFIKNGHKVCCISPILICDNTYKRKIRNMLIMTQARTGILALAVFAFIYLLNMKDFKREAKIGSVLLKS